MSNPGTPGIVVAGFGSGADLVRRLARRNEIGDVICTDHRSCVISIAGGLPGSMRAQDRMEGLAELLGSAAIVFMISDSKECMRTTRLAARVAEVSDTVVMVFMIEDSQQISENRRFSNNEWICERSSAVVVDAPTDLDELRLSKMIACISSMLLEPSMINLDLADLRTIMRCGTEACIISGTGRSPELALRDALDLSLMDPGRARGCLLHITGGTGLTLRDANHIAESVTGALDPRANVIWGMRVRGDLEMIEITAVLTGKNIMRSSTDMQLEGLRNSRSASL